MKALSDCSTEPPLGLLRRRLSRAFLSCQYLLFVFLIIHNMANRPAFAAFSVLRRSVVCFIHIFCKRFQNSLIGATGSSGELPFSRNAFRCSDSNAIREFAADCAALFYRWRGSLAAGENSPNLVERTSRFCTLWTIRINSQVGFQIVTRRLILCVVNMNVCQKHL